MSDLARVTGMRDTTAGQANGPTISVDFSTLRILAGQLRDLAQHLSNRCAIVQPALDRDLYGKLSDVESDWTSHRHKLQSFLADTASTVDQIVAEYEKTNDMITRATSGP